MDALQAATVLRWWDAAGVDTLVDDSPHSWLAPAGLPRPPARVETPAAAPPRTLDAFAAWLSDPATFPALGTRRFAPVGIPSAGLMVIVDMPEAEDRAGLLEGSAGRLLDRMLAAIGRDRASVYLVPLAPARPAGGRIPPDLRAPLAEAARRHLALAAPRRVLLMGQMAVEAFALDWPHSRGRQHILNHDGGTVPAITTFHPRFLLTHPACKADAWADLRLLTGITDG